MSFRLLLPPLALAALAAGQVQSPPPDPGKEAAMGAFFAREIRRESTPLDSAAAQAYVDEVGQRLAAQLPDVGFPYHFAVTLTDHSNSTHEPLSTPGGYVFVPASLLLAAQDEAEFAAMLAHAMAHAVERHNSPPTSAAVGVATIPLVFMSGRQDADNLSTTFFPAAYIKAQRSEELAVDRLAVRALAAAGYDSGALARYVRRVQGKSSLQSVLPPPDVRLAQLDAFAAPPRSDSTASGAAFAAIQEEVRSAVPEPALMQGIPGPRQPPTLRRPGEH